MIKNLSFILNLNILYIMVILLRISILKIIKNVNK